MPYQQIPEYPENYSPGNIISRLIDGLGYRYYWATDSLTKTDLEYKPSTEGFSAYETIEHIYWLSIMITNTAQNLPCVRLTPTDLSIMTFDSLREKTLSNLKKASELYTGKTKDDIDNYIIIIQREEHKGEFPFWHMINGPISDAIYHTGQIVSFRRTTGNPIDSKVNVFTGKARS
ncbi:hypothetical protein ATE84_3738 [Aquimarina sp. MAR_2010_214]|uniref:hypothetical protein n=1 Tax=Aquimarina sp. MAR_2010_214 TaxID=1250026 RepID=UPI000C711B92|nr:hypothetical protein [Aquimarina sp. MAR_2010_214]PKV51648.1 hypothetical protein ATE84_3738 [Aquimarina sp. MAR_2010_214]